MRRKILAGMLAMSLTASMFSGLSYIPAKAAEYEASSVVQEEAGTEEGSTEASEISSEASELTTETTSESALEGDTDSEETILREEPVREDFLEEENLLSSGDVVESGAYDTWSWSLDADGLLLIDGVVTMPGYTWPWERYKVKTAKVTGSGEGAISGMFSGCSNLISVDLSNFDTGNVMYMSYMFHDCSSLTSVDLSNFDTGNVMYMSYMFHDCSSLTSLDLSNFDTSKVTDMGGMFCGCSGLTSLDVDNFDTSKVTDMHDMFCGCSGLTSLDVDNFDTSKVTDMRYMFSSCNGLTNLDLSNFNVCNVTDAGNMLAVCTKLTEIKSPYNIPVSVNLQDTYYKWLDEDGQEVSEMHQNLSTSVTYKRYKLLLHGNIIFDGNGATGGSMESFLFNDESATVLPSNTYTRTGFVFFGWNTSPDGWWLDVNDAADIDEIFPWIVDSETDSVILYAQWKPISYTIHFDKNGGTGTMKRVYPKYGRNYRLPVNTFAKAGYTFAGWNTRKDGKGTTYKNQSNVKNLSSTQGKVITLYAQWNKISLATPGKPALGNYAAGRLTVTCKEVKRADGYLIQYSTNKNMKNAKAVSSTTLKKNIYNLKKGTTYYVRVRAYKVDSAGKKIYGKYSSIQSKKITK